jgi:hypothetical protein
MERWNAFLAKIDAHARELLVQAEEGCAALLDMNDLDPMPMTNAWNAIDLQMKALVRKIDDTYREKVEPLDDSPALAEQGAALSRRIEHDLEETGIRVFADAARKIFDQAKANLAREFRCTQCGAALPVSDRFFRSRHVSCAYCKNVNTFLPGAKVQAVEHFCCHHLAQQKTRALWLEWIAAEQAMDRDGGVGAAERALLAYTEAYLRARIEIVPEYEKDFEKDKKGRMAFFYARTA